MGLALRLGSAIIAHRFLRVGVLGHWQLWQSSRVSVVFFLSKFGTFCVLAAVHFLFVQGTGADPADGAILYGTCL